MTKLADIALSKNAHELIIHGEKGSGKSFLMQAICNELSSSGKQFAFIPMNKALKMGGRNISKFSLFRCSMY